ncbi:hypothetical protein SAMN05421881_10221 [Nitrosomonas halophila]|uniref:Uncharacterized protein n=1 Tax=Nitrosomonas halophila TaxID=44576 RepID=A0A1H3HVA3_9PROT|nr:hypothetical protein SAMN05421881_10221 [Nitrosomonas halophila]
MKVLQDQATDDQTRITQLAAMTDSQRIQKAHGYTVTWEPGTTRLHSIHCSAGTATLLITYRNLPDFSAGISLTCSTLTTTCLPSLD